MLWGNCMSYSQITGGEGEIQHCKWISALCRIPPIPTCHSLLEYRLPQIPINNLHVYSRTEKQKWWWLHMSVRLSFWNGLFCIVTLHHFQINCFVCMYFFFKKYWRIYCHWFMQKNKCELTLVEKCMYYNCFSFALNANYYDRCDSCLVFSIYSLS